MKKSVLLIPILFFAIVASATDLPSVPFLVTSGEAQIDIKPNQASVRFSLEVFDKSSENGLKAFTKKSFELINLFKKFNIGKDDVEAEELDKDIIRKRTERYKETGIIGYEFSRDYCITINKLTSYSAFITQLFKLNNIKVQSSTFSNDKQEEFEEKLMMNAMQNAKDKAEKLAKIAGSELLGVYAISEGGFTNLGTRFLLSGYDYSDDYEVVAPIALECFGDEEETGGMKLQDTVGIPTKIQVKAKIKAIFKLK